MNGNVPIYNTRLLKPLYEYTVKNYPDIDFNDVFEYSGIQQYEMDDPGHWISQEQSDLFYEALKNKTENPDLAKISSRHISEISEMGAVRQYAFGLLTPKAVYLSAGKIMNTVVRGIRIKTKGLSGNKVEILSIPETYINEKPYQCEYRIGSFESFARPLTGKYANVKHLECIHKGDKHCRYVVSWDMTRDLVWKRWRNIFFLLSILLSAGSFFVLPLTIWGYVPLLCTLITVALTGMSCSSKEKLLADSIEQQGDAAKDLIQEINIRHNHSLLVQNIGMATAITLEEKEIALTVMEMGGLYLDYDLGFMMLVDDKNTALNFVAGYGLSRSQESILKYAGVSLSGADSENYYRRCFLEKTAFLISNVDKETARVCIAGALYDTQSFICVPIIYEHKCYGVIAMNNTKTKRVLNQTDLSLIRGIASQTALSLANATAYRKLRINEKKYRDLVENANSIIMRQTPEGDITFFNGYAQNYFGFPENEIVGKNVVGVIFPDSEISRKYITKMAEALTENPEQQMNRETKCMLNNSEPAWISWTYRPIFDPLGRLKEILCVGNDITALKAAEIEKRNLQAQLQQARKMEAIGTFAGGIAHDFNNILGSIILNTELAYNETQDNEKVGYPLSQVIRSSEYAKDLVKRILAFARKTDLALKPLSITNIVEETIKLVRAMLPSTIVITEDIMCEDTIIMGDAAQIQQLVVNLCKNAAQAMGTDGGGLIAISLDLVDSGIQLSVKDNGPGMTPDVVERIFDPFFTTKPVGVGTGLGLSMVQRIVQDHKGDISVKSRMDDGTTFNICFPVTRKKVELKKEEKNHILPTGKESILIIDDEKVLLDANKRAFEKLGYVITACDDGKQAMQIFKENPDKFDLVITDMTMPFMTGDKLAEAFKKMRPDILVILCTGYSEFINKNKATGIGIDKYLTKPINLKTFAYSIREVLDRRVNASEAASG